MIPILVETIKLVLSSSDSNARFFFPYEIGIQFQNIK